MSVVTRAEQQRGEREEEKMTMNITTPTFLSRNAESNHH